ncbi:MAG TPA: PAS domain S-box protein [Terracidiphilus sp.]|nr:PAS domain S-box protein [Terracidiphilus sp.]
MSFSRQRRLTTAMLGIASLVLIAFVGLSYRQWEQYRRANAEAERSREISTAIDGVLGSITEAEAGQRGFLLTGENRYLQPYNQAVQELPSDLLTLKELLRGNRRGAQDFDNLNSLAKKKLDELRETIEVRRARGAQAALAIVLSDEGKRTMDSIRALCAQMERDENANQARASANGQAAAGIALLVTVAGSLVLLFFFAFGLEPFASPDPRAWQRSWVLRYGAAILAVVATTLIRAALTPLMGPMAMPFTLYFCAVAFAAWFGGFRPAVLSTVLSVLAGAWFFAAPTRSLLVSGHDDQIAMLLMVVVGFGMALLSRSQRNAVDRAVRAEDSERNERQRSEITLASIGDAVIATDGEGRVAFANKVALSLVGWTDGEIAGKPLDEVFRIENEVTRAAVENPVTRVLREGTAVALANHTVLIARDGTEVPIDDSAAPIRDADGEMIGAVLVFRDISVRRTAENLLAAQAAELRRRAEIMEHAQLLVRDMDDRIGYWNRGAEQLYGYTALEALGQVSHSLLKTQFPEPLEAVQAQLMSTGEWDGEVTHIKRDGSRIIVTSHWTLHRDADGHPVAILEVNSDISERKRVEDELHRERERLGLALSAGKMGVFEVNPIENTLWWSTETYSLFGVNPPDIKPTPESFAALIHPGDREPFMQYWRENIGHHQPMNHEFRILNADGKERWISCRGTPRYDDSGLPIYYSGLFVEITERKGAEQVLRNFEKLSAAARLSAAIAHEINNPLSAVTNLIYLAKEAPGVPGAIVEQLELAEQELERVAHAARQALGFYRESYKAERIDIPELMESVLKVFSSRIAGKKIKIVRGFLECAPVYGVRGEIRQVVSNLLANAIEAVKDGGTISLGTRPVDSGEERAIQFIVADDGHGIAAEHLDHVFEPFFTTKVGTGTGLGLWVAKEIIERHKGQIEVQHAGNDGERCGATFTVKLPGEPGARVADPPVNPGTPVKKLEQDRSDGRGAGNARG